MLISSVFKAVLCADIVVCLKLCCVLISSVFKAVLCADI